MTIERKIREHLHDEAETMECPPAISKRIEQSYSQFFQPKRSKNNMKKRLISGIVAAALLIPTAAFAAPTLIGMLTRTPMSAEQVKEDKVGNAALEKLYSAFPETKSFEIIDASSVQGVQTSIILQEKGGTGKKFTLHTNSITGEIEHMNQENWEPKEKPLVALTDQEIKAKVDYLIDKMYGHIEEYEFAIDQMKDAPQKTLMLNYTKKGSNTPFYQVFVHGNSIDLSRIGGEKAPSNMKVEGAFAKDGKPETNIKVSGFFSKDGKPYYFADVFLNDPKLFSLLKMSPTELKEELAKGKSVVEIAASKNISKQQVIDVIANTQADSQLQGENNGDVPKNSLSLEQMAKAIEPKAAYIVEYKNETPSKK